MFPSSHDLTPENWDHGRIVLNKLLMRGNDVLIVSKPHLDVVTLICSEFIAYQSQIMFRFTIGSTDDKILSIWEPGAPGYQERKQALKYAYDAGFKTSISCEPMLDAVNIVTLVENLTPYVTHTLWIGKMNYLHKIKITSNEIEMEVARIRDSQSDACILAIYEALKNNPLIRWKDSIKKIVGIERSTTPGLDI